MGKMAITPDLLATEINMLGKLGLGTMTDPKTQAWTVRIIFFWITNQKARQAIDGLHAECRGALSELWRISNILLPNDSGASIPPVTIKKITSTGFTIKRHYVQTWATLCEAAEQYPCADEIKDRLWTWATQRNLAVEWFLDTALLMLCLAKSEQTCPWSYGGSFSGSEGGMRYGGPLSTQLMQLGRAQPRPVLTSYNPAAQDRKDYLLDAQKRLAVYCDGIEAEFECNGFQRTIRKRQRSGPQWLHVEWFVRHRVELWPTSRIAKESRVAEDIVCKALRRTAELLGFPKGRLRKVSSPMR
jgi:hypothetical protein